MREATREELVERIAELEQTQDYLTAELFEAQNKLARVGDIWFTPGRKVDAELVDALDAILSDTPKVLAVVDGYAPPDYGDDLGSKIPPPFLHWAFESAHDEYFLPVALSDSVYKKPVTVIVLEKEAE